MARKATVATPLIPRPIATAIAPSGSGFFSWTRETRLIGSSADRPTVLGA